MDCQGRFAANLRRERLLAGLSQERLAQKCGLHATEVSRLERGVRDPRLTTICRIAKGLDIAPAALIADC